MNAQPRIQSVGIPPDKHAEPITDQMLAYLHAEYGRLWDNVAGSLAKKQLGNPIAQQRAVARFARAAGALALDIQLQTGKRGKFHLVFVSWLLWDPARDTMADTKLPPPATAWLAIGYASTGRSLEWTCGVPLLLRRHACVRLAQRAGVRTVADLMTALRELWDAMAVLIEERGGAGSPDGVRMWD